MGTQGMGGCISTVHDGLALLPPFDFFQ
ncbi:uncharacterized protein G2W53_008462 [Senna tora]|uniref:Uncharacterized protein n=1 Tax=Senna tora TaxID=362788 RepID=A0A834X8E2_9FABA|nr:uncharacterized protein G2W53_008462 [Senna tora]